MDYWGEMPFYQMDLWELKTAFAGVFTASRVSQAAFRTASVPAHILCGPSSCFTQTLRGAACMFTLLVARPRIEQLVHPDHSLAQPHY